MQARWISTSSLLVALLSSAASAEVWIVDASGAGDFLDIKPAVEAAADWDSILIRSGSYTQSPILIEADRRNKLGFGEGRRWRGGGMGLARGRMVSDRARC